MNESQYNGSSSEEDSSKSNSLAGNTRSRGEEEEVDGDCSPEEGFNAPSPEGI